MLRNDQCPSQSKVSKTKLLALLTVLYKRRDSKKILDYEKLQIGLEYSFSRALSVSFPRICPFSCLPEYDSLQKLAHRKKSDNWVFNDRLKRKRKTCNDVIYDVQMAFARVLCLEQMQIKQHLVVGLVNCDNYKSSLRTLWCTQPL